MENAVKRLFITCLFTAFFVFVAAGHSSNTLDLQPVEPVTSEMQRVGQNTATARDVEQNTDADGDEEFYHRLCRSALELTRDRVTYDPAYYRIPYPGGDVPADRGVCTDVVIRAYRRVGIDLQKEVHEDMRSNFPKYPKIWGLSAPDRNIDHRRVPNLMVFFTRHGEVLALSPDASHYRPGDIVCWQLRDGSTHIGIVSDKKNRSGERYQMIHNIGAGQVMEDCLFNYKIIGHYRYRRGRVGTEPARPGLVPTRPNP